MRDSRGVNGVNGVNGVSGIKQPCRELKCGACHANSRGVNGVHGVKQPSMQRVTKCRASAVSTASTASSSPPERHQVWRLPSKTATSRGIKPRETAVSTASMAALHQVVKSNARATQDSGGVNDVNGINRVKQPSRESPSAASTASTASSNPPESHQVPRLPRETVAASTASSNPPKSHQLPRLPRKTAAAPRVSTASRSPPCRESDTKCRACHAGQPGVNHVSGIKQPSLPESHQVPRLPRKTAVASTA